MHGTPGAQNGTFNPSHSNFTIADYSFTVDIVDEPIASAQVTCYPNPFRTEAAIVWEQSAEANVVIELYSANGFTMSRICDDVFADGWHTVDITEMASNWSAGLYFAKITIGGQPPVIIKIMKQ